MTATRRQPDQTRQTLLQRAFEEIHRCGFRAAGLDSILKASGVTKGALYYHFASKTELGYAVVEEIVRPWVEDKWKPVLDAPDPIDAAIDLVHSHMAANSELALSLGCPFNNLCQEMAPEDAGFRTRLTKILQEWRQGIETAIERGQREGAVRADADPSAVAAFLISAIEGCIGMAKPARSREFLEASMRGLIDYLESLRPPAAEGS